MNQSGVSVHEPITVGAVGVTLIEGAAKDLKDFTVARQPGARVQRPRCSSSNRS